MYNRFASVQTDRRRNEREGMHGSQLDSVHHALDRNLAIEAIAAQRRIMGRERQVLWKRARYATCHFIACDEQAHSGIKAYDVRSDGSALARSRLQVLR